MRASTAAAAVLQVAVRLRLIVVGVREGTKERGRAGEDGRGHGGRGKDSAVREMNTQSGNENTDASRARTED